MNNKQLNSTLNTQAYDSREYVEGPYVPCNNVTPVNCFYKVTYRLWLTQEWDYIIFDAKDNADAVETARAKLHSVWLRRGDFTIESFTISTIADDGEIIDIATLNDNIDYLYADNSQSDCHNVQVGSHPDEWYLTHSVEEWTDFPF